MPSESAFRRHRSKGLPNEKIFPKNHRALLCPCRTLCPSLNHDPSYPPIRPNRANHRPRPFHRSRQLRPTARYAVQRRCCRRRRQLSAECVHRLAQPRPRAISHRYRRHRAFPRMGQTRADHTKRRRGVDCAECQTLARRGRIYRYGAYRIKPRQRQRGYLV